MRLTRLIAMLLAVEILFLGGSAYYQLVFPVRVMHHILITVVLVLWLLLRLKNRQGLPHTPLNIPLFAAAAVWVMSAVMSDDPRMAFENLWFLFTHLVFFWIFADLIQRRQQRLLFEVQFIAAALVLMLSALELASWYFGLGIIPGTSIGWAETTGLPYIAPRLTLALNISTLLAGYAAPLVIVTAGWALTARRPYRVALWLLSAGLLIVLILTFSRGGCCHWRQEQGCCWSYRSGMGHCSATAFAVRHSGVPLRSVCWPPELPLWCWWSSLWAAHHGPAAIRCASICGVLHW